MRKVLLAVLVAAFACCASAQVAVSGTKIQSSPGTLLVSGQWCAGITCLTVTNGAFSGSVTAGTYTVTVVNASSVTILSVTGVVIGGSNYNWDLYTVPSGVTFSGNGAPYMGCQLAAQYTQNDSVPSGVVWSCNVQSGQLAWQSQGPPTPVGPGIISGNGVPTMVGVVPTIYIRTDVAQQYYLSGPTGATSTTWNLQVNATSAVVLAPTAAQYVSGFPLGINLSGQTPPTLPTNTDFVAIGASGSPARMTVINYGGTSYFTGITYGGTASSPTALTSAQEIGGYNAGGYDGTAVGYPVGALRVFANQNWSVGSHGTYADIATTPNGSTTEAQVIKFNNDGGITTPGQTDEGAGTVNAAGLYAAGVATSGTVSSGTAWSPTFYGATGTVAGGTTPFTGFEYWPGSGPPVAATTSNLASFLSGLSGCSTLGNAYQPANGACASVTGSGASLSAANTFTATNTFPKLTISQTSPSNPSGFSCLGCANVPTNSALGGGADFFGNGSTYSGGITSFAISSHYGIGLYGTHTSKQMDIVFWPTASGAAYPTGFTGANAPYILAYNGFTSTQPIYIKPASAPSNPAGFSGFGSSLTPTGSTWGGGWTEFDNGANYTNGGAVVMGYSIGGGVYNQTLFASGSTHQEGILLCPNPTGTAYPGASPAGECEGASSVLPNFGNAYQLAPFDFEYNGFWSTVPINNLDPVSSTSVANKIYVDTAALTRSSQPPKLAVCYGSTDDAWGDSITCGVGSNGTGSCNAATSYANQAAVLTGCSYTVTNHGVAGDQACDLVNHVFNTTFGTENTMMIGINNATSKGVGVNPEFMYEQCFGAAIARITMAANTVAGSTFTVNAGTWTNDTTYSSVTGLKTDVSLGGSAAATGTITTTDGPIFFWYRLLDSNAAGTVQFTYSLNGGSAVTVPAYTATEISTANGATTGVGYIRIPPPGAGSQTVKFTNTTSGTPSGTVSILGLTTTPANVYYTGPVLTLNTITFDSQNNNWATYAQYADDVLTVGNQFIADGLDVRIYDPRVAMQDNATALTYDGLHPNGTGATAIATGMYPYMALAPGPRVLRGTPASSSAACTAGETWSDARVASGTAYVYSCKSSGSIQRSALSTF